ncbi:MAG: hypothetical protein OER95_15070, partial [Acidimicrobiia bacterium]|nr:hypothetical protein [Acidimicrobiia bacterium]
MTATDTDLSGVPLQPAHSENQSGGTDQSGDPSWASVVGGVVLVALGATWLLSLLDVIDLRAAFVLPAMLALVGLALTVASVRGNSHPGLIVLGTFLAVATCFAAVAPAESLRGGLGERVHVVTNAADLEARYELGLGDL